MSIFRYYLIDAVLSPVEPGMGMPIISLFLRFGFSSYLDFSERLDLERFADGEMCW